MVYMQTPFGFEHVSRFCKGSGGHQTTITHVGGHNNIHLSTCYGTITATRGKIYTWDIMINYGNRIMIGVSYVDMPQNHMDDYAFHNEKIGYAYFGYNGDIWTNGSWEKYGHAVAIDDVIRVSLDLDVIHYAGQKYGKLSFAQNGRNYGVAFGSLPINKCYRLAVSLWGLDTSVTIVSRFANQK